MPDQDIDELFARHDAGLADDAELTARLLADPAARRAMVLHARVSAILARSPAMPARIPRRAPPRQPRRTPARAWRWGLAAGVAIAIGVAIAVSSAARHGSDHGWRIAALTGDASVSGPLGVRSVRSGDELAEHETLSAGGPVVIAGADQLDLAAGSRLTVLGLQRLGLDAGSMRIVAAHRSRNEAPLVVATPHATAEVIGTRFALAVSGNGTRLEVEEGAVRFACPGRGTVTASAGQAALAEADLVSLAPAATAPAARPDGLAVWLPDLAADGWYGFLDPAAGRACRRAAPPDIVDTREAQVRVRSPIDRDGWTVGAATSLRFSYFAAGFPPGSSLRVMLKRADLSNFACDLVPDNGAWRDVTLHPCDGSFVSLKPPGGALAAGERIHGVVWVGMNDQPMAARLWIRDVTAVDPSPPR